MTFMLQNFLMCLTIMLLILTVLKGHKDKHQLSVTVMRNQRDRWPKGTRRPQAHGASHWDTRARCERAFTVAFFNKGI